MGNILFVNTFSCFSSYSGTRVNAVVQVYPLLSHAILSAVARNLGETVEILDLGIISNWQNELTEKIKDFKPDMICMTSTTPLFPEVSEVSFFIRKLVGDNVLLMVGGPHATALPEVSLQQSAFDVLVTGEGEEVFNKLLKGTSYKKIPGVHYKEDGNIYSTPGYSTVDDMESIPYPAFDLYDLSRYKCPKILNRLSPMTNYMTSRGCAWKCSFCNKNIYGTKMRFKSPEGVIDEIKYMLKAGIREVRIIDDMFTAHMDRAKKICELIIQNNLKFPWTLAAGVRVDKIDLEFLTLAKRSGLYQVALGFESGDQQALDSIDKGITIEQSYRAMALVKKAKIESVGFFMYGLPTDTEESLKKTLAFAKKLSPSYAKVTITIPFPGTRLFEEYDRKGLIKSKDWRKYNLHSAAEIFQHPNLSIETLDKYYNRFYYSFYLRPGYLISTFFRTLKDLTLFYHIYYGFQTFMPSIFKTNPSK